MSSRFRTDLTRGVQGMRADVAGHGEANTEYRTARQCTWAKARSATCSPEANAKGNMTMGDGCFVESAGAGNQARHQLDPLGQEPASSTPHLADAFDAYGKESLGHQDQSLHGE